MSDKAANEESVSNLDKFVDLCQVFNQDALTTNFIYLGLFNDNKSDLVVLITQCSDVVSIIEIKYRSVQNPEPEAIRNASTVRKFKFREDLGSFAFMRSLTWSSTKGKGFGLAQTAKHIFYRSKEWLVFEGNEISREKSLQPKQSQKKYNGKMEGLFFVLEDGLLTRYT